MKKLVVIIIVMAFTLNLNAINVKNEPWTIIQPDGTKIECFITGDEFGGMVHDINGYALLIPVLS